MNFLAYAIMGIPAGNMLTKFGYKKTALIAIAVGFFGVLVQFLSGVVASFPANFIVYLLGAFISGFSVCMLNTVVNPMLKLLGGRRSNQYIQIGGSFNSLMGTLTPMLVGALIGTLTAQSKIADVNPVLFIAMGVFAAAFVALLFIPIEDPEAVKTQVKAENPMNYRHFVYGGDRHLPVCRRRGRHPGHAQLLPFRLRQRCGSRPVRGRPYGRLRGRYLLVPDAHRPTHLQLHQR